MRPGPRRQNRRRRRASLRPLRPRRDRRPQAAGEDARGATAYVTLEPCSHHGRTGPCADALIGAGVVRCIVATRRPQPAGKRTRYHRLRDAGIAVEIGLGQARARALNNAFACSISRHRPFVTLKSALSVDGRIAPPPSLRIPNQPYLLTGPASRDQVQRLRHAHDAILTGIGTVLADDPLLTDRTGLPRRRPLMRVVLDSRLQTPLSAKLVQTASAGPVDLLWTERPRRPPSSARSRRYQANLPRTCAPFIAVSSR